MDNWIFHEHFFGSMDYGFIVSLRLINIDLHRIPVITTNRSICCPRKRKKTAKGVGK